MVEVYKDRSSPTHLRKLSDIHMKPFRILLVNIWGLKSYYVQKCKNDKVKKYKNTPLHTANSCKERGKGMLCWHTDGFVMDID